jgi:hypothetical protein
VSPSLQSYNRNAFDISENQISWVPDNRGGREMREAAERQDSLILERISKQAEARAKNQPQHRPMLSV